MPQGSDPNERTEQDKRLFTAIRDDNLEGVKEVLDAGANPNAIEGHHHTALSRAVVTDNSKIAGHLLDRGADPNARSGSGETPLHYGCSASRKVREQMLTAGANPNAPDQIGQTPLHLAVTNERYLETIQQLLAAGADPNARTVSGRTPLHVATERPVVERLLTWKADPNAPDKHGRTPLHDAVSNPDTSNQMRFERVTLLLNANANPRAKDELGNTPLHYAARRAGKAVRSGREECRQDRLRMPVAACAPTLPVYSPTAARGKNHKEKASNRSPWGLLNSLFALHLHGFGASALPVVREAAGQENGG